jgi:hypothetical protein
VEILFKQFLKDFHDFRSRTSLLWRKTPNSVLSQLILRERFASRGVALFAAYFQTAAGRSYNL